MGQGPRTVDPYDQKSSPISPSTLEQQHSLCSRKLPSCLGPVADAYVQGTCDCRYLTVPSLNHVVARQRVNLFDRVTQGGQHRLVVLPEDRWRQSMCRRCTGELNRKPKLRNCP